MIINIFTRFMFIFMNLALNFGTSCVYMKYVSSTIQDVCIALIICIYIWRVRPKTKTIFKRIKRMSGTVIGRSRYIYWDNGRLSYVYGPVFRVSVCAVHQVPETVVAPRPDRVHYSAVLHRLRVHVGHSNRQPIDGPRRLGGHPSVLRDTFVLVRARGSGKQTNDRRDGAIYNITCNIKFRKQIYAGVSASAVNEFDHFTSRIHLRNKCEISEWDG